MKSDLVQSGVNEAQAAAIVNAMAGSEARTREHLDTLFATLSAQIAENAKANVARHEQSEKVNAARHEQSEKVNAARHEQSEKVNAARHEKLLALIAANAKANAERHEKLEARYDKLIDQMFGIHNAVRRLLFWLLGGGGGIAAIIALLSKFL